LKGQTGIKTMARVKIKTIDITALMWLDKPAANTYFTGTVTVNYGMKGERSFLIPFQYGYNDVYQFEALKVLENEGVIDDYEKNGRPAAWRYCQERGIILRANKTEGRKRSELNQFIEDFKKA
jgi:hypothetical protein